MKLNLSSSLQRQLSVTGEVCAVKTAGLSTVVPNHHPSSPMHLFMQSLMYMSLNTLGNLI